MGIRRVFLAILLLMASSSLLPILVSQAHAAGVTPSFAGFTYTQNLSLSASGGVQTFKTGLGCNNSCMYSLAQLQVTGSNSIGDTFSATSSVISISSCVNKCISVMVAFSSSSVGTTYSFSANLLCDNSTPLMFTCDTTSGSFLVKP